MWERTLQDLIRGLRANKKDEAQFIAQAIAEIRNEIRTDDMELKAAAVLKLTYLEMMGYDIGWASFHILEVMSSPRAHLKSIGYLGATQSFNEDTDVLMLTTNLLKKDLGSNPADVAITLNGLSHIMTPDLARDLSPELIAMLNHSRPNIRKRAILMMQKVFTKYPDAVPKGMPRFKDKLQDSDPGVVAATVNVLCELVRVNPQEYLILAPQLFHLMTTSSNNWMLIKIIKIFGSLSPHEPRLVKKLQAPITDLISTTPAISLLYECVHTCIIGGMLLTSGGNELARLCVSKLANFIQDADQNLKYIALLAMVKIVPSHPYLVSEYQDTIMASVSDQDVSIRMRALDLVSAMASRDNVQSIVQQLLSHLVADPSSNLPSAVQSLAQHSVATASNASALPSPNQNPAYRQTLSTRILQICSQNTYENISNFEWYISVLVDLAHVARPGAAAAAATNGNATVGTLISDQLVDVVSRVRNESVRRFAVGLMRDLVLDERFLESEGACREVLWAAGFVCGEYCRFINSPQTLISHLLHPRISALHPDTIAVYIQAALKIFGYYTADLADRWTEVDEEVEVEKVRGSVGEMLEGLKVFCASGKIEVRERALNFHQLLIFVQADLSSYKPKPSSKPRLQPTLQNKPSSSSLASRDSGSNTSTNGAAIEFPSSSLGFSLPEEEANPFSSVTPPRSPSPSLPHSSSPHPDSSFAHAAADSSAPNTPSITSTPAAADTTLAADPAYPKSLRLVGPLFEAYELNPVAGMAQESVPVPEGLDLDAWIVPPRQAVEAAEGVVRKKRSGKDNERDKDKDRTKGKGKGKSKSGKRSKVKGDAAGADGGGLLVEDVEEVLMPVEVEETAEEREEIERKRAERLERMRDDPYYIIDDKPSRPASGSGSRSAGAGYSLRAVHDVDAIPIEYLDDMDPLPPPTPSNGPSASSPSPAGLRSLQAGSSTVEDSPYYTAPEPVVFDREGEMPAGIVRPLSLTQPQPQRGYKLKSAASNTSHTGYTQQPSSTSTSTSSRPSSLRYSSRPPSEPGSRTGTPGTTSGVGLPRYEYDVGEDIDLPRSGAGTPQPQPIKVQRAKKKKSGKERRKGDE